MLTTSQYFEARRLWAKGLSFKAIVQRVGADTNSLKHQIEANREDFPKRYRSYNPSKELIETVAARKASGEPFTRIARDVGIERASLYRYLREVDTC